MKPALLIHGMHGLGDCLHQRAMVRILMKTRDVYLETSWVSLYHDLIEDGLRVMHKPTRLRTQTKNAARERAEFWHGEVPRAHETVAIHYGHDTISRTASGTILQAMMNSAGVGAHFDVADYSLPIPDAWFTPVEALVASWNIPDDKPLMIYRPLTVRPEWRGGERRNADPAVYAAALAAIRHRYFVVSVADLQPGREWIVGPQFKPDVAIHDGSLPFESLAALFAMADLVMTSGGFATILASAVKTPVISIIGGERAGWHADAAKYAPYLGLECRDGLAAVSENCVRFSDSLDHPNAWFTQPVTDLFGPEEHGASIEPTRADDPRPAAVRGRISPYATGNVRIFPRLDVDRHKILQDMGLKA